MLQRGDNAREICYFVVVFTLPLFLATCWGIIRFFFSAFSFGVAQVFKRRFCSGI